MLTFEDLNSAYPVKYLLENIGLRKVEERENYFRFSSPFKEDKNPSMVLYKKNLMCIDFSSNYTKSFFTFVKDITGDSLFNVAGLDKEKINSKMFENSL